MAGLRTNGPQFGHGESYVSVCILLTLVFFAPILVQGQCQPIGSSAKSQASPSRNSAAGQPEFFDEPQFTVAGVTDTTNVGGHGSDARMRASDALARETVALGKAPVASPTSSLSNAAMEKSLREAAEQEPGNFAANHQLGKMLVDTGRAREAIPYLERAAQLNPGDYENAYQFALAQADAGDYDGARTRVRTLLTAQDKAELHHLLADIEGKLGSPLEAIRQYQRAAELDPSEPNLFDWGAELLVHHAATPAIEVFTKGNRLHPRSVRMLVGMGVGWYARGSYDRAAYHLCQASDLNPNAPSPYLYLGTMQSVETNSSEGIAERLERFSRLEPDNALANYYYAVSLWKRRKGPEDTMTVAQAQSLLEKAVHLDPKLGAGYLQLGVLYSEKKDWPNAVSTYEKAIAASPRLEEAHYRLAQAYRQTGEAQNAQREIQLYKQLSKESADEAARQRREMQQFVYTLRDGSSGSPPQEPK